MKKTILFSLTAALCFISTNCKKGDDSGGGGGGAAAVTEKAAIEAFKKAGLEMKTFMDDFQAKTKSGPPSQEMIDGVMAKMKAMPTSGLPADLKSAFEGIRGSMEKMFGILKDIPKDPAEIQKKMTENPEFMKPIQEKMEAIQKEGDAAQKKMTEVAKKYGLEDVFDDKKKKAETAPDTGSGAPPK